MSAFDPKPFLANLSQRPGVYRMIAADGEVLYVGKARNLKNRVSTYFSGSKAHGGKTMAMVAQIASIEVTATASETEALLLEYNLIKRHRPRYNVTLRDDKSFPYLYITTEQDYPRISLLSRHSQAAGAILRSVSQRARDPRDRVAAAEAVPAASMQRLVLRKPLAAVPAVPDQALLRSVRRPDLGRELQAGRRGCDQGAGRARCGADRRSRAAHGGGRAAARVRTRRAPARSDQRHQGDSLDAVGHAQRDRGHRCCRTRFARRRSLRLDRVRARRPQPRQLELLSARRAWRRRASCSRASSRSTTWAATRPARSSSVSRSRTRTCSKPRCRSDWSAPCGSARAFAACARAGSRWREPTPSSGSTCAGRPRRRRPSSCSPSPRCSGSARRRSAWSAST